MHRWQNTGGVSATSASSSTSMTRRSDSKFSISACTTSAPIAEKIGMTTKADLHRLVDGLPEENLPAAERALTTLQDEDPVLRAFMNAPLDDEPLTEEDIAAIEEAHEDIRLGRTYAWEEVRDQLLGQS